MERMQAGEAAAPSRVLASEAAALCSSPLCRTAAMPVSRLNCAATQQGEPVEQAAEAQLARMERNCAFNL